MNERRQTKRKKYVLFQPPDLHVLAILAQCHGHCVKARATDRRKADSQPDGQQGNHRRTEKETDQMYVDTHWTPVEGEELAGFLEQINPVDGKHKVSAASTSVSWRMLPFYEQVALVRVKDPNWSNPGLTIYYLTDQGELYRLNGTSPPIHDVNAKAPVRITEENVLDYLRFFCFFVRGEEGPFLIAENPNDPYLPKDSDPRTRSVIDGTIRPASYEGRNEQGFFLCDAVVYYSNALFIANFAVQPGGMIEMLSDEPIAADLPVKVDAPIS